MKLEKLRLKGWTGIQKGLGLDEIEIDFSKISGLTALEGINGAGKSTCLENLHPFNQLASRTGALYQHTCSRKAEKELSFIYNGHHYKTLLKVDCESERSEGFIWKDGKSEVNGKISAFAKYIKELLGSPELFFSSVFCAQNSRKLSDMRTGELKALFAEFLRLDRFQTWEATAKQAGNILQGKASNFDIRISTLKNSIQDKDALTENYLSYGQKLEFLRDDKTMAEHELEEKRKAVESYQEIISKNAVLLSQIAEIEKTIARLTNDMDAEKKAGESEMDRLKAEYKQLAKEIEKCDAILKDKDAIIGAAEKEKGLEAYIQTLGPDIEIIAAEISANNEQAYHLLKDVQVLKAEAGEYRRMIVEQGKDPDLIALNMQLASIRDKMVALDKKDPECKSVTCSFIKGALDAADMLLPLQENIMEREKSLEEKNAGLSKDIEEIEKDVATKNKEILERQKATEKLNATLNAKRKDLDSARTRLAVSKEMARKLAEVQVAEQRKEDFLLRAGEVAQQGVAKRDALNAMATRRQSEVDVKKQEALDIAKQIDREAETKLSMLKFEINGIEKNKIPGIEKATNDIRDKMAGLQAEISKIADAEIEVQEVNIKRESIQKEISEWRYLQTACGKNGLQALEIDGAAPLITGYANDLLSKSFGPAFSVKLLTQDEEGKETLDVMVIGEDGDEDLLENKSGGEKVFCLMALRLAMTLLSKEKSGNIFTTAFSDESDGALDPENALNYVSMYRSFMQVGGFDDFLFISHRPECRNMADNVLVFEHGKNPYWR